MDLFEYLEVLGHTPEQIAVIIAAILKAGGTI